MFTKNREVIAARRLSLGISSHTLPSSLRRLFWNLSWQSLGMLFCVCFYKVPGGYYPDDFSGLNYG